MKQSACLVILDGWGHAKPSMSNAITLAKTPFYDHLVKNALFTTLHAGAEHLDLPPDQFGNSEVGHMTIGAGRIFLSDLKRIRNDLSGHFPLDISTPCIHLLGLFSSGGVHSHNDHIQLLLKQLLKQTSSQIVLHIMTDGRDRPIQAFKEDFHPIYTLYKANSNRMTISTLGGRYFGMDRDKNWDRIESYIDKIQSKESEHGFDEWIKHYPYGEQSDEFIQPISFSHAPIKESDTVICCNFRADRAIQILKRIQMLNPTTIMGATDYPGLTNIQNIFPKPKASHGLGEVVSHQNIKQIRIAETEKYAHVTYFFNLLQDIPYPLEDRVLIPSDKVDSFDLMPDMKAKEITQTVIENMSTYGLTICNFANADMVGHTGNLNATVSSVETIDQCLQMIHLECLKTNTALIITADHGNADQMHQQDGSPSTSHSLAKVPLIICNTNNQNILQNDQLTLDCIAPTVLDIMGLEKPEQMTSQSVLCK
jgi:2,3-bisphosphoglycerate-independent phosphoglycerate mutase